MNWSVSSSVICHSEISEANSATAPTAAASGTARRSAASPTANSVALHRRRSGGGASGSGPNSTTASGCVGPGRQAAGRTT